MLQKENFEFLVDARAECDAHISHWKFMDP